LAANPKVYTTDSDFDEGVLVNVNHDTPNNDQLQLNDAGSIQTLPIMYIANGGEDTISKIDTNTGDEVARYRSWFGPAGQPGHVSHLGNPFTGPAPSRSAVDADGNCYVANRGFGMVPTLMKILNGSYIDRNGNGVVDTSIDADSSGTIDPSEIFPLADNDPANGMVDQAEIQDERVAWIVPVGPQNGLARSVSIAPDGNIWVGLYNSRTYQAFDQNTGAALTSTFSTAAHRPYGSLVFSNGELYSASLSGSLGRLDTNTGTFAQFFHSGSNYGIGIGNDPTNSNNPMVVLGNTNLNDFIKFDIPSSTFTYPAATTVNSYGISVDGNNDVFCSDDAGGGARVGCSKWRADGTLLWSSPVQPGGIFGDQRGAIVDANGDVWTVNKNSNSISKYDGGTGAPLGVTPVGNQPYTYSDASGSSFIQTNPTGTWAVVYDAGERGAKNCTFSWTAQTPGGSSLEVIADASDTKTSVGDFNPNDAIAVSNGVPVTSLAGRYVYIRVRFVSANQISPILEDLAVSCCPQHGDVNDDCCVDRTDFNLVLSEIRARGNNLLYDVNGDGMVNIADARRVAVLFCNPVTGDPCVP
jgi:hypothetical protein